MVDRLRLGSITHLHPYHANSMSTKQLKNGSGVVIMNRRPQPKGVPLSGPMVREKEKRRNAYFKGPDGSCSGECTVRGFQASEGWFNKFKVRQSLQNIKIVGEAGSADTVAAERYPKEFANLVADGAYKPEQLQVEASLLNQVAWLALLGRGPVGAVLFVFVESFSEEISTLERKTAVQLIGSHCIICCCCEDDNTCVAAPLDSPPLQLSSHHLARSAADKLQILPFENRMLLSDSMTEFSILCCSSTLVSCSSFVLSNGAFASNGIFPPSFIVVVFTSADSSGKRSFPALDGYSNF
ncbi:hypothetical protein GQX74_014914 [Glossina fuscipes]|nr:hypothetical protein GQX74_014914 [Glossina fuscipes]